MNIGVHVCKDAVVQTNMCVSVCPYYMYVFIRKEGRAIRNQTEAVCASCPPCLKASCDHFVPREVDRMKERSEQVAKRKIKELPSKAGHINAFQPCYRESHPLLLLSNNTHRHTHTPTKTQPSKATKTLGWLCSEQQQRA